MSKRTCSIPGCNKQHIARGMCSMHYERARRAGEFTPGPIPPEERFWAKVDKTDECWIWTGGTTGSGYGYFSPAKSRMVRAHRYVYEITYGEIPDGSEIDHVCGTRTCVRPDHLRVLKHKQNGEHRVSENINTPTGYRGVTKKRGRFVARVGHNKKTIYVGTYDTVEEAALAAKKKRNELFTHNDRDR